MSTNLIKKQLESGEWKGKLAAAEWAAIAREKGLTDHAKAWDIRAMELGQERIPNGVTVRFDENKQKHRIFLIFPPFSARG